MLRVHFMFSSLPLKVRAEVYRASCRAPLALPFFLGRVPAGFPSPANDYLEGELDLNDLLIENPASTFYVRLAGDSMI
jgi:DNA polymerase V